GDFNGDGATDLACRSGENVLVLLSQHTTFAPAGNWASAWCAAPGYHFTGDFNGDGQTDLACRSAGGEQMVRLSSGTGVAASTAWLSGWCVRGDGIGMSQDGTQSDYLYTGDFNGDGKEDLGCRTGGRQ